MQAFRRPESPYESARFVLRGLDPEATYGLRDIDAKDTARIPGRELMGKGLLVTIPNRSGAAIILCRRVE